MRVLLVDDEEELVSALAERLEMRGFTTRFAVDCGTALEIARRERFDVALLDVKMPRMSGLELKKRLQEIDPELRFIFLTGHGSEADYRTGVQDAEAYLGKPLQIEELIEVLRRVSGGLENVPPKGNGS